MTCQVSGCGGHVRNGICDKCGAQYPIKDGAKPSTGPKGGDKKGGGTKTIPNDGK